VSSTANPTCAKRPARASRRRSRRSTIPQQRRAHARGRRGDPHRPAALQPSFNYLSQLLVGSLDQASRLNVHLIVEKCDDEAEEKSAVEHLIRARLDGIILTRR
jgi:hypothetical protein